MKTLLWIIILLIGGGLIAGALWYSGLDENNEVVASQSQQLSQKQGGYSYSPTAQELTNNYISEKIETQVLVTESETETTPLEETTASNTNSKQEIIAGSSPTQKIKEVAETIVTASGNIIPGDMEVIVLPDTTSSAVLKNTTSDNYGIDQQKTSRPKLPRISVMPFNIVGEISSSAKDFDVILCDALMSEIDSDEYEIYERTQLKKILEVHGFNQSQLVNNPENAAAAGKLAKLDYVILGTLADACGVYSLNVRLVKCETGLANPRAWTKFNSLRQWPDMIPELVNLLGLRKGSIPSVGISETSENSISYTSYTPDKISSLDMIIGSVNRDLDFGLTIDTVEKKSVYKEGEYIQFEVSARKDCFVTLITLDSVGDATLLMPNQFQPRAFIHRNQKVLIPSQSSNFRFPITPPHGEILVKAIATLQPLVLSGINDNNSQPFTALSANTKAIGLEGFTPSNEVSGSHDAISLHDVLAGQQWATAELVVITSDCKQIATSVNSETVQPVDTDKTEVIGLDTSENQNIDANDKLMQRWQELTGSIGAMQNSAIKPSSNPFSRKTDNMMVWYNNTNGFKMVSRPHTGTKSVNGSKGLGKITADSKIKLVVPNLILRSFGLPATKLVDVQWALKNQFQQNIDIQWDLSSERLSRIKPPLIGVVDSSFDPMDPRLADAAWVNHGEVPDNRIDDDGNGFIDDVYGYNFTNSTGRLYDSSTKFSHGTFVSSIIAGRCCGSSSDVIGVVPRGKIINAVSLGSQDKNDPWTSEGQLSNVISGITYVVDQGARVVNLSFGVNVNAEELISINKMPIWDELQEKGVILVCAAGNEHSDNDKKAVFPASLPRDNVISVMAIDANGLPGRAWDKNQKMWVEFSNFGQNSVHIAAPGTLILGASGPDQAELLSGTSYSAAIVTGVVALTWGQKPEYDYTQVIDSVIKNANISSYFKTKCISGAIINIAK